MPEDPPQLPDSSSPPRGFYANSMGLHAGPFDLTVDFGHAIPDDQEEFRPEVRVSMSYHHAASLAVALRQAIEFHEEQTGHRIGAVLVPGEQKPPEGS